MGCHKSQVGFDGSQKEISSNTVDPQHDSLGLTKSEDVKTKTRARFYPWIAEGLIENCSSSSSSNKTPRLRRPREIGHLARASTAA